MRNLLTPYFTVVDAERLVAFLQSVFGGEIVRDVRSADGTIAHARVAIGASLVMLNQAGGAYKAQISQMHIEVGDVDNTYRRALEFGARSLMDPNNRPHGARMAGVEDPCGNIWWIASDK